MTGLAETVYGVDFASSAGDAGEKTWIATATVEDGILSVDSCRRLVDELGCDSGRESAHEALTGFVRELDSDSAIGLDFPFGLPRHVLDGDEWGEYVVGFPNGLPVPDWSDDDLPAEIDSPDALSAWGSQRARDTDAGCVHCKRVTDAEHGAQPPYGIIGKSITFHGLKNVVAPLAADDGVTVAPMEVDSFEEFARPDGPLVLEAYPAGTLDRLGLCREGYKDGTNADRRRERNLDGLVRFADVRIDDEVGDSAIDDPGGDALDAVVAAVATYEATRSADTLDPDEDHYDPVEGYIYV